MMGPTLPIYIVKNSLQSSINHRLFGKRKADLNLKIHSIKIDQAVFKLLAIVFENCL